MVLKKVQIVDRNGVPTSRWVNVDKDGNSTPASRPRSTKVNAVPPTPAPTTPHHLTPFVTKGGYETVMPPQENLKERVINFPQDQYDAEIVFSNLSFEAASPQDLVNAQPDDYVAVNYHVGKLWALKTFADTIENGEYEDLSEAVASAQEALRTLRGEFAKNGYQEEAYGVDGVKIDLNGNYA